MYDFVEQFIDTYMAGNGPLYRNLWTDFWQANCVRQLFRHLFQMINVSLEDSIFPLNFFLVYPLFAKRSDILNEVISRLPMNLKSQCSIEEIWSTTVTEERCDVPLSMCHRNLMSPRVIQLFMLWKNIYPDDFLNLDTQFVLCYLRKKACHPCSVPKEVPSSIGPTAEEKSPPTALSRNDTERLQMAPEGDSIALLQDLVQVSQDVNNVYSKDIAAEISRNQASFLSFEKVIFNVPSGSFM
jgi:hypothetical protein